MNFKHEETKEKGCIVKYCVTLSKEEVGKERDRVINNLLPTAKFPGFRPGKVPREVFEKKFDEKISKNLLESIVPTVYKEIVEKDKIKVYYGPDFSNIKFESGQDMQECSKACEEQWI